MIYYVNNVIGSDTNPGTESQPWKSIAKVNAVTLNPGDTVLFKRGEIWQEVLRLSQSGTVNHPITYGAYGTGVYPIIDGYNTIPGEGGALIQITGNYNIVTGIEIYRSHYFGIYVSSDHNIMDDVYVFMSYMNGIIIYGNYNTVQNSNIRQSSMEHAYGNGTQYGAGLVSAQHGIGIVNHGNIFRKNEVWETWGDGLEIWSSDHITLEDNIVHDNSNSQFYLSESMYVLVQRNFIYSNPASITAGYDSDAGIMLGDESTQVIPHDYIITNNIVYNTNRNFYWWAGYPEAIMDNVLISNNTFLNSIGTANCVIQDASHVNVRWFNNIIEQDDDLTIFITSPIGITYSNNNWSKNPPSIALGSGDIIRNPLLSKTGNPFIPSYYRLQVNSPVLNKGISLPEVTDDYFGNSRTIAPSMGAIEGTNMSITVNLTGISSGNTPVTPITITATTDTTLLGVVVNYTDPATTGSLTLTPTGLEGVATVTVTVNNNEPKNNLTVKTFKVTLKKLNPPLLDNISDIVIYL
jgi:parallel beta-helix repeat protein